MSMGRHQTGSLRQLPSGRIQVRYTGPDGRRRAAQQTFPNRALARRWLALTVADMSVNLGRQHLPGTAQPSQTRPAVPKSRL
jgi:hypothetical protein